MTIFNSGLKRSHLLASESSDQLSDRNSVITTSFNLLQSIAELKYFVLDGVGVTMGVTDLTRPRLFFMIRMPNGTE